MNEKQSPQDLLNSLKVELDKTTKLKDQVWKYHPQNPEFSNPITLFDNLKSKIKDLECKIKEVEFKINSLN